MMLRTAIAILAVSLFGQGSAASPTPKARKSASSRATKRPAPKASKTKRKGKFSKPLRRGRVPATKTRLDHSKVVRPSKKFIGSRRARKPVSWRSMAKPTKVSFEPCAAALPEQAPSGIAPKGMQRAVSERSYRWPTGATLRVGFVDGGQEVREAVKALANQWTEHANLKFQFFMDTAPADLDILIVFDTDACTSNLGTSSRYSTERGEPSMNLCHLDQKMGTDRFRRVVLHEFGHALALHHEHQSPKMNVQWNKEAVYDYYGALGGWDRDYVDHWVFRRIDPAVADSSEYDPDSVMHYSFPPEFTTNGVAFGGATTMSAIDKSFIAEVYPGKRRPSRRRRYERKIAVRNDTSQALDIQSIYQTKSGKSVMWAPEADLADAPEVRVPAGAERMLDGVGRRLKLVARSTDDRKVWGEWETTPLQIAPKGGYLDREIQTYVVVIDGPPDATKEKTQSQLWSSASKALDNRRYDDARVLFGEFIERFPAAAKVPWARFNIIVSWYEEDRAEEALGESYELIVDHPKADATPYAWFYGGLSALQLGWCEGAQNYLEYASEERSGLPADWRSSASEYLAVIDKNPKDWCW